MKSAGMIKFGLIAIVIAAIYFSKNSDNYVEDEIDLNRVLDVTVDTLYAYQEKLDAVVGEAEVASDAMQSEQTEQSELDKQYAQEKADKAFLEFSESLATSYNNAQPTIYTKGSIGVTPRNDASLLAFVDTNGNLEHEESEDALFLIEIDGENARIIASSRSGAINEHHFSGTSLLTGYLIGSMLSRQRSAGVTSKSLSSKKPVTARAAAKARAGSGSHSRGK